MKILYAAGLSPNDSSFYRLLALERLGHQVIPVNTYDYRYDNPFLRKVFLRLAAGPMVTRLNLDLLRIAAAEKPDLLWTDKLLLMQPATLDRMKEMGIVTVSYMIDNPFGPRQDPGWRLYMKDIPHYDLHVVQRDKNILDYRQRGARDVIKIQTAYEPTIHFPPPEGWSDKDRDRGVSFIGTPYDNRAEFLTRLWKEFGFPVSVSGGLVWKPALGAEAVAAIYRGHGELFRDEYREGIWKSPINLSFITHSNEDEFVHKSFEIAGCGGFLLAERSEGHMQRFREDEEAVFFTGMEECVAKIRRYLPDEAARARIAAAGHARAVRDGYHNDRQVGLIVERAERIIQKMRTDTGAHS
ncbi:MULTISPECIES: glycosyltransferase [Acidobacteriaceae]|uniref:CgeB family protein n=1 Tax=Acidobacteriaceae TaxID=204434 RepID=UPI00131ECBB4|nr:MULTISPECIES: glycosyltransferase [Acidobacteriaceae]MDW5266589.1 glycosyltransferase [Edaphobacter sp.]